MHNNAKHAIIHKKNVKSFKHIQCILNQYLHVSRTYKIRLIYHACLRKSK